jgi:hypothetical protein
VNVRSDSTTKCIVTICLNVYFGSIVRKIIILCSNKVLKLSTASVADSVDTGCVINLLGVDALKMSQMVRSSLEIITLPIYLVLAACFLYSNLAALSADSSAPFASLIGIAAMLLLVPLTTLFMAWKTKRLQVCGKLLSVKR